jgi:hypothetical protein
MKELLDFQKKVSAIKKDGKNPHFKSTYATLTQILSEVKPVLSECGLIVMQPIRDNRVGTIVTNGDKLTIESWIELPVGLNPQQLGSAITYFRRYTLAALLSLEIEDDDANLATVKPSKQSCTPQTLKKMLDAISTGQREQVVKAMDNYSFTPEQDLELKTALNK